MTWEETEYAVVSRAEALAEVAAHGVPTAEFLAECGSLAEYSAREVLYWLGY